MVVACLLLLLLCDLFFSFSWVSMYHLYHAVVQEMYYTVVSSKGLVQEGNSVLWTFALIPCKRHFNVRICSWWSDTSFPFLINIILFCLDTTVTSAEVLSTCYGNLLWYHVVQFVNLRVSIYLSYRVAVAKISGELGIASPATRSATVWTLNTPSQLRLASTINCSSRIQEVQHACLERHPFPHRRWVAMQTNCHAFPGRSKTVEIVLATAPSMRRHILF